MNKYMYIFMYMHIFVQQERGRGGGDLRGDGGGLPRALPLERHTSICQNAAAGTPYVYIQTPCIYTFLYMYKHLHQMISMFVYPVQERGGGEGDSCGNGGGIPRAVPLERLACVVMFFNVVTAQHFCSSFIHLSSNFVHLSSNFV